MSEGALSEAAMRASLIDIRLPPEAAGGVWADLAIAIGLAGFLAVVVAALARLASQKRPAPTALNVQERLADIALLPAAERRVALLHLLREQAPERYADLAPGLYRPDGGPALDDLTAEVARLA